jgi:hypothetical protein
MRSGWSLTNNNRSKFFNNYFLFPAKKSISHRCGATVWVYYFSNLKKGSLTIDNGELIISDQCKT